MTGAERARRYRERQKAREAGGQQSGPARSSAEPVTVTVTSRRDGVTLDAAGQQLWAELDGDGAAGGRRALILEACRIADRLDKLDRLLRGDAADWLDIVETRGNPLRQELVINAPLAEARQQATALKQILGELRQAGSKQQTGRRSAAMNQETVGGGGVADLTARIRARREAPAG